jgi:hypothetical protein
VFHAEDIYPTTRQEHLLEDECKRLRARVRLLTAENERLKRALEPPTNPPENERLKRALEPPTNPPVEGNGRQDCEWCEGDQDFCDGQECEK